LSLGFLFNSNNETVFDSPPITDIGAYNLTFYIEETGVSPCFFPPSYRSMTIRVNKPPPVINYNIPDYLSLRVGVRFEIVFPNKPWLDPVGEPLTYILFSASDSPPPVFISYEPSNLTLYGTAPNGDHGGYSLKLRWYDTYAQSINQIFDLYFFQNNKATQAITDLASYKITVGERKDYDFILPSGKYLYQIRTNHTFWKRRNLIFLKE